MLAILSGSSVDHYCLHSVVYHIYILGVALRPNDVTCLSVTVVASMVAKWNEGMSADWMRIGGHEEDMDPHVEHNITQNKSKGNKLIWGSNKRDIL
jgi:hypothetical protein